ncbi:MAG TPA: response regulator transcription factor [Bacteroidia bacterium]|nr:response regulator transcription factor [Bacteroidia bacterium]HNU33423.1 response regulator transcription factor [Bacteroidia bacterium]
MTESLNILIADDHQLFRQGLEKLIKRRPFSNHIYHAQNGREAIDIVNTHKIDLIFMDVRMPIIDGIEATKTIVKAYPEIKVLGLTMLEDKESVVRMFKAGARGYLLKNTDIEEIELAVKDICAGKRYYSKELNDILLEQGISPKQWIRASSLKVELTEREIEIIKLLAQGFKSKEISEMLFISDRTVDNHRMRIYERIKAKNMVDVIFFAIEHGIIESRKSSL